MLETVAKAFEVFVHSPQINIRLHSVGNGYKVDENMANYYFNIYDLFGYSMSPLFTNANFAVETR